VCKFVFPSKDVGFICPSTFKVAFMMAARRQFSLAIPALTSIFMGLKETQSALGERLHETPIFLFIFSAVGLQKNLASIKQPLALLG